MTRKTQSDPLIQEEEKKQVAGKVVSYLPKANREEAQLARALETPEQLFAKIDRAIEPSSREADRDVAAIVRLAAMEARRVGLHLRTRSG